MNRATMFPPRDLTPLTEEEIKAIMDTQDTFYGNEHGMTWQEFLKQLYEICPPGHAQVNTKDMVNLLNLRVAYHNIKKKNPYTDFSVRQKVFMGNKADRVGELARPEGTSMLFPLDPREEKLLFNGTMGNQHWFLLRDGLMVQLTRYPGKKSTDRPKKERGRPAIRRAAQLQRQIEKKLQAIDILKRMDVSQEALAAEFQALADLQSKEN